MSLRTQNIGRQGERLAEEHLLAQGARLLERNYRIDYGEIDLLFDHDDDLVAVEVKTRDVADLEQPEEAVRWDQLRRIGRALATYAMDNDLLERSWRIDVVVIVIEPDGSILRLDHLRHVLSRVKERLHKVLAHAGVASRRAAERMILDHRIRVNGSVVVELGTQVDPAADRIEVDGRPLPTNEPSLHYVALHKPSGVVSTAFDPEGRPTVVNLVNARQRLYPVGRLDIDSEGLVLLTDDGDLTFRLAHARFGVEKEYHVLVACADFGEQHLEQLRRGVVLDDGPARVVRADLLRTTARGALVRVVLVEGRQRQVRRMLATLGCAVDGLQRVRIGPLRLGDLEPGQHRSLRPREVEALRSAVGLKG